VGIADLRDGRREPLSRAAAAENKPASTAQAQQSFETLVANASTERGAQVAEQCMICHNLQEGQGPKVGPDLYGVVGRLVASMPNFHYSAARPGAAPGCSTP